MKALINFYLLVLCSIGLIAQVVPFGPADQRLKVYYGERVYILADSAYVISIERALLLNEKLKELKAAHDANAGLFQAHRELLEKIAEMEQWLGMLLQKLQQDDLRVQVDMDALLSGLDRSIALLKAANAQLEVSNIDLKRQLAEMDQTVKHLKKEVRRIRWRGVGQKVGIGLVGFLIGVVAV